MKINYKMSFGPLLRTNHLRLFNTHDVKGVETYPPPHTLNDSQTQILNPDTVAKDADNIGPMRSQPLKSE